MTARIFPVTGLLLVLGLAPAGPLAAQPVDQTRPMQADGAVLVKNVAGRVRVQTWDRNQLQVTGVLGPGVKALQISGSPSDMQVVVKLPEHSSEGGASTLDIKLPRLARLTAETVSADVSVRGLGGGLAVKSVSGEVNLQVDSPQVSVRTVSGDVTLTAPADKSDFHTVSGDLHLSGLHGRLEAETVSGDLTLIGGGPFSSVAAKSVSGPLRLKLAPDPGSRIDADTLSGDIDLDLPEKPAGTATLKSFSGDVGCSAASSTASDSSDWSEQHRLSCHWGSGSGTDVELSSFSGDIRLRRH